MAQIESNQKHESHRNHNETVYWCRQWKLLAIELSHTFLRTKLNMSKQYRIEIQLGKNWYHVDTFTRQVDALHHIKENSGERYPMRIVRVVKTVVFEEKK
jgi:hypothetical protein